MIAFQSLQNALKALFTRSSISASSVQADASDNSTLTGATRTKTLETRSLWAQWWIAHRLTLLSLTLIILGSFYYGRALLNFDPQMILTGKEVEWTLETDVVAWNSLLQYGELPLWNPYWNAGRPLLADPFFHGLDPKMLVPQAIFGVMNGAKIGIILSFVLLGVGGWWLGSVMGLGHFGRTWLGLMLALNGHIIGYFSGVGSVGLGLSYVYVVWVIAATLALRKTPSPRNAVLFALSVALLFLASNLYFFVYTAIALGFIMGCETLRVAVRKQEWQTYRTFLIYLVQGSLLALAFSAIVALPQIEVIPYLAKPGIDDTTIAGQPIEALFNNFIISDNAYYQTSLFNLYGHMVGHYSYIGVLPFLFLLGVPLTWHYGKKREILWLIGILCFGLTYAAGTHTPLWNFYRNLPGAGSLRFPERAIGLALIAILALAAIGLDKWWQLSKGKIYTVTLESGSGGSEPPVVLGINLTRIVGIVIAFAAVWGIYQGNMQHLSLSRRNPDNDNALAFVRNEIGDREFHLLVPVDFPPLATSQSNIGQINGPQTWVMNRGTSPQDWVQIMHLGAEYALMFSDILPPEQMGRNEQIATFAGFTLYRLPDAMPYAYTTAWETTFTQALTEAPDFVTPLTAARPSLRRIHIQATTSANQRLVAAESYYPGWQAFIDDTPVPLEQFDGFLSIRTVEGNHEYSFYFDPLIPKIGILLTFLAIPYGFWVYWQNRWLPLRRKQHPIPQETIESSASTEQ